MRLEKTNVPERLQSLQWFPHHPCYLLHWQLDMSHRPHTKHHFMMWNSLKIQPYICSRNTNSFTPLSSLQVTRITQWTRTHTDVAGAQGPQSQLELSMEMAYLRLWVRTGHCTQTHNHLLTHSYGAVQLTYIKANRSGSLDSSYTILAHTRLHTVEAEQVFFFFFFCCLSVECELDLPLTQSSFMQVILRISIQRLSHLNLDRASIKRDVPRINSTCHSPWNVGRAFGLITAHTVVFWRSLNRVFHHMTSVTCWCLVEM